MALENAERRSFQYQMPNLNIPNPPSDLPYSEFEDFRNLEILKANGIALSEAELLAALEKQTSILQAAAAHALGSLPSPAAITIISLKKLLGSSDDLVKVEVAYALARRGVAEGREILEQCLSYRLDAHLFPAIAAGCLARLGDPQGFGTVVRCFDVEISAIRMLACKQLSFFVPFHGLQDKSGIRMDVFRQFDRALRDSDTNIQWQALVQLREIDLPNASEILEEYIGDAVDEQLRDTARGILEKRAKPDPRGAGISS